MGLNFNHAAFWIASESDFNRFRAAAEDAAIWPPTYALWLKSFQMGVAEQAKRGVILAKVEANPDDFAAWCRVHSKVSNVRSRCDYAVEQFAKRSYRNN